MSERIMTRGFPWGEPAHPGIVKQFEDLVNIYKIIRAQHQDAIDNAFDQASRDIGFVVSTTIPVTADVAAGKAPQFAVADSIKGSVFERAVTAAFKEPRAEAWAKAPAGQHQLYLIWFDALNLKLRKDWLEPVHFLAQEALGLVTQTAAKVRPEVQEPAHWFLPSVTIAADEKLLISAIDTVYPELQLAQRISNTRQVLRSVRPEVMEPAHPGTIRSADSALREISNIFKRVGPGIPEPAHHLTLERNILAEIEAVVRKFGM